MSGTVVQLQALSRVATVCLWLTPALLFAERLPVKTYTTADGLPNDSINRIFQDGRGFLWFATGDGLARFDGYQFTTYGVEQGLPHRSVNDLLQSRDGVLWLATAGGLCRFNPAAGAAQRFIVYRPNAEERLQGVNALLQDRAGTIWCGTRGGPYKLESRNGRLELVRADIEIPPAADHFVNTLFEDRQGALWVSAGTKLYRHWKNGPTESFDLPPGIPYNAVYSLAEDANGRLWAGTQHGLGRITQAPTPGKPLFDRVFQAQDGLPGDRINALFRASDGKLWIGAAGLAELTNVDGSPGRQFRIWSTANGLSDAVFDVTEDRDGNLWIANESAGAMKITRSGFTTYTKSDGLASPRVTSIFQDQAGAICIIAGPTSRIHRLDGRQFKAIPLQIPPHIRYFGWGWHQITFQDHTGEWWVSTGQGLLRFPSTNSVDQLRNVAPKAVYTTKDGLGGNEVFRLFEDSRGDIWIGTITEGPSLLTRWRRSTGQFQRYTEADGIPSGADGGAPAAFSEDGSGTLWIGFYTGGLARFQDGTFRTLTAAEGAPSGGIRFLYLDGAHRLWVATSRSGLSRIDNPSAERPRFVPYGIAQGLSSTDIWAMTEDRLGRIYLSTSRGVDRLDLNDGSVKHYTRADGLPLGSANTAFRDRHGDIWFGTSEGATRLTPELERPATAPTVLINSVRIAGVSQSVSELGETEAGRFTLQPSHNQIQVDFVGLGFGSGESLNYQYMLEGADQSWTAPAKQRSVNYASLRAGSYRFLVRALNVNGVPSPTPASLQLTVLPPIWQRWWFVSFAVLALLLLIYTAHRYRVARLLELERVRTRIATDLHDDIGSSLSQIVILSELVRQQAGTRLEHAAAPLSRITHVSRELVDSMSDIVWAINPKKDHLGDLAQRMRRFSGDLLASRGIELRFRVGGAGERRLMAEVRREVFLIFKESINNMARHSGCTEVDIDFEVSRDWLYLRLSDNGAGFDPDRSAAGAGLASMAERARRIGGQLDLDSGPGHGTTVTLRIPLAHRSSWALRFLRK
jgi:ligand-binding sensor domain-containing protein/signal transduction histidine kinase